MRVSGGTAARRSKLTGKKSRCWAPASARTQDAEDGIELASVVWDSVGMVRPEQLVDAEWAEWYRLSSAERWLQSEKLWEAFLILGGSVDPEPDTQSPFFDPRAPRPRPVDGRAGVRVVRRSGV